MAEMPREFEAFSELVAQFIRRMQPDDPVELIGPKELLVAGRRLDLENLYRLVMHDPSQGQEIVEHYLDQLFSGGTELVSEVSYEFAKPRVMPRIQPASIFEHLNAEHVAHVPYVNGTVIVFVIDLPQMTVSVTTEQAIRWGVDMDELEELARQNLDRYSPELELQLVESKEGGRAAVLTQQDGYDAARLLMNGLFTRLAPQLGGKDFFVATPSRDMFIAMSPGPDGFLDRLRGRIEQDYRRLPYPITSELFYVTRDGVAGTRDAA